MQIREVLAFPFMRTEKQLSSKERFAAEVVDIQPLPEEGIGEQLRPRCTKLGADFLGQVTSSLALKTPAGED
jgi:hypothetical protein